MLFNSFQFAIFFLTVYGLYLSLNHKWQNRMLLIASYIFYGAWNWKFLSLIWISTLLDYTCGRKISQSRSKKKKKLFLAFSVIGNLSILGFFKYFNFFSENLQELLQVFGLGTQPRFLNIILPIGISFYTFQTMSYTLDIYKKKMKPTKQFFDFALFVAFFPQLVAGPIERAKNLLPQILKPRKLKLKQFNEGAYLILWGLFLKVFIADNLARIVDPVFASSGPYNGVAVLLAVYAFAFQIFCDFAGYSNIARGLCKCMGFEIMINFNLPYFSVNPSEFWRRWHISLSSWLKDYLYIPLGGNQKGSLLTYRNLAITMLLGGLWHGAAWTFILWGAYQGALLIGHRLLQPFLNKLPKTKNEWLQKILFLIKVFVFFQFVCLGWLIFRAESLSQIVLMLKSIFCQFELVSGVGLKGMAQTLFSHLWLLLTIQIFCYRKNDLLTVLTWPLWARAFIYILIYISLVSFGATGGNEFIYFQF